MSGVIEDILEDEALPPSLADLIERLGGIDPRRVLSEPPPGTATEADLVRLNERKRRLYELDEGALVEKAMGAREAYLAMWIGRLIGRYLDENNIGVLFGADGGFRLMPGLVRLPDVTFIRREKLPRGRIPNEPYPGLAPDLAVEVLSPSNTAGEIARKLRQYFLAGTTLAWVVDPRSRTVVVHERPGEGQTLTEADTLDGGSVLPGFQLPVARLFEEMPPEEPPAPARKRKPKP